MITPKTYARRQPVPDRPVQPHAASNGASRWGSEHKAHVQAAQTEPTYCCFAKRCKRTPVAA